MREQYGMLTVALEDGVCLVALNRPEKLNALTAGFSSDVQELLADAGEAADVRALILHGTGEAFSVGADIDEFHALPDVPARRRHQEHAYAAFRAWETFAKPTVAAVHGYALGGGCELTMLADLAICDETAQFGMPEASVGLMPGVGVVRGHANTNLHWLKHMIFTGARLHADEARLAGLVTHVVPAGHHLDEARTLAARVAQQPAVALQVAKRILNRGSGEGYDYSVEATALLHGTRDQQEGVAAFRERRRATFRDG